jgi:hypothetical protein
MESGGNIHLLSNADITRSFPLMTPPIVSLGVRGIAPLGLAVSGHSTITRPASMTGVALDERRIKPPAELSFASVDIVT